MVDRDVVLDVVVRNLVEVLPHLEGRSIDPSVSMKELGATSLDMVEIVSSSMRQLKIKVPRSELSDLENIDELVDLLHRVAEQKAAV